MRFVPPKTLVFSDELRARLKEPLGLLIQGRPEETRSAILAKLRGHQGRVIAVGDVVSRELTALGIKVSAYIVDDRIERNEVERFKALGVEEIRCRNDAGTISRQAYAAVTLAVNSDTPMVVRVRGEEDLLGLVAIAEAPDGSIVVYGQPKIGVVMVEIGDEARSRAINILNEAAAS